MMGITLFDFQDKASEYIKDYCYNKSNKKTLIVQSPTGSGKTLILIDFIDKYMRLKTVPTCVVWLTPGTGDLEDQSKKQFDKYQPGLKSKYLRDIISAPFEDTDTCFINWEMLINKKNNALIDGERRSIFHRIAEAHRNGIQFILIIDEEHRNATAKAEDIINAFNPVYEIRVSATAQRNSLYDWYEIDERDAIACGLITKSIFINDGIDTSKTVSDENQLLIDKVEDLRVQIRNRYSELGKDINPLVLIQFPNESPRLIKQIEEKLKARSITYDNGLLSINMSDPSMKKNYNKDQIVRNNSFIQYLMFKEALGTGWDCPRAKILIKLRENMSEDFEIQVLGRIRRTPEAKHYDDTLLDNSYLFTFDEDFKNEALRKNKNAHLVKRIFLKKDHKDFSLIKELRNRDYSGAGERETRIKLYNFLKTKYSLSDSIESNRQNLEAKGFVFSSSLQRNIVQDEVIKTLDTTNAKMQTVDIRFEVNTHSHGIELQHAYGSFRSLVGLNYEEVKDIMELLFRDNRKCKQKLLALNTNDYYAFIINNQHLFREDFREGLRGASIQQSFSMLIREETWKIPLEEVFKYNPTQDPEPITINVYDGYTDECLSDPLRSTPERLFERWLENNQNCTWYYKNGDVGQGYFSIVYYDGNRAQWLFYPDYLVELNNELWIIETKGGENAQGVSENIDNDASNKFEALKKYATKHILKWCFVRNKNEKLYFNNTQWTEDMSEEWKSIKRINS